MKQKFLCLENGERIFCCFTNAQKGNQWFIFCHGLFHDKNESWFILSKLRNKLANETFSICQYDNRGCGDSSGHMNLHNMINDIQFIYNYIKGKYEPDKIYLVGVGFGCNIACSIADYIDGIILLNPTYGEIFHFDRFFGYEKRDSDKILNFTEEIISKDLMNILENSGILYWNFYGNCISYKELYEFSNYKLGTQMKNINFPCWQALVSKSKTDVISSLLNYKEKDYRNNLQIIDSDPLFTNPKIIDNILEIIVQWLKCEI